MYLKPIVGDEILKIINKFNQNKSAGHDNIGNYIIKRVSKEISIPLKEGSGKHNIGHYMLDK